ncbi:MAG: protein kinase, partial [Myxococcales bacterium]|nr:protein kinase [Myxococcales bacterium]
MSVRLAGAGPRDPASGASAAWERLARVGAGSTSVVWRARRADTGEAAALKVADGGVPAAEALVREARLLARVHRRWGPRLLDAGRGFLVTEWVPGEPLRSQPSAERGAPERERRAAQLAHALGRALEELHEAGVRHGDVKPENVLVAGGEPRSDDAAERVATLIDLGLATSFEQPALGGTPRYAAPELRDRGEAGPAADLWALGALLAEVLDPELARVEDLTRALSAGALPRLGRGEPARWVRALLASAPGGRPGAAWVADRAARFLGLRRDAGAVAQARIERVRRTYLAERDRDLRPRAVVAPAIQGPAAAWLESAIAWCSRLSDLPDDDRGRPAVEPLPAVRLARWCVSLVGPSAASWPILADPPPEGELVERAIALCAERDPSAFTFEDLAGRGGPRGAGWDPGEGADRAARLVRELARRVPDPEALAAAEDDVARGHGGATVACELAAALLRVGEAGRAWAALAEVPGDEAALAEVPGDEAEVLRAEVARRRGDRATSEACARRALAAERGPCRWRAKAVLARLAWDAGDLDAADACLEGAAGPAAAEVGALVAWRRGAVDLGLALVARGLAAASDSDE